MSSGHAQSFSRKRAAACLLLSFGLALAAVGVASPVAAQEPVQAGGAAELVKFAPEGTWAVAAIEVSKLLSASVFDSVRQMDPESWQETQGYEAAVFFILPMKLPLDDAPEPAFCGLVKLGAGQRQRLEEKMAEDKLDQDVAGLAAYQGGDMIVAFVDDTTLALGVNEEALTTIIRARQSGPGAGLGAELSGLVKPHAGRQIRGGVVLPAPFGQALSPEAAEDMPEWARGLSAGAIGIDLAEGLALRLHMRLTTAEGAQQLLKEAQEGLAEAKDDMKAMQDQMMMAEGAAPMLAVFDKVKMTAEGQDFRVSLDLEKDELATFPGFMFMPFMMGMGGGMRAEPAELTGEAAKAVSKSNLHNIGLGVLMYRNAHQNEYPANLSALFDARYLEDDEVLIDPNDWAPEMDQQSGRLHSYQYVGRVPPNVPPNFILAYSRKGVYEDGRNVLYADGAVEWVAEADLTKKDGARGLSLADCYQWAAANWQGALGEADKARLRKFFEVKE